MATLLLHNNTVFEDQTVYATGNAYFGCEFHRCTIIMKGFPFHFETCEFDGCIWVVDVVIHDRVQMTEFLEFLTKMKDSLPSVQEVEPDTASQESGDTPL